MGFKEAPHPISVRQAEIIESRSTLRVLEILGNISSSPLFSPSLICCKCTYKQDTKTWDTENATSENVSDSRPSLFPFSEMHPGLQETKGCCGGSTVAGQPSILPASPELISQYPTKPGTLTTSGGSPWIHPHPCSRLTSDFARSWYCKTSCYFAIGWGLVQLHDICVITRKHTRLVI